MVSSFAGKRLRLALFFVPFFLLPLSSPAFSQSHKPAVEAVNENGFNSSRWCGTCHKQIYDRWKGSMHSRATSDPIFRASYIQAYYSSKGKAAKLCLSCHAPTSIVTGEIDLEVSIASEGITCDFCHSVKEINDNHEFPFELDMGSVKYGPNKEGSVKRHKVAHSEIHTKSEFCATCHQYTPNGVPVMTTYDEWKDSAYADEGKQCQYCHMPQVTGEIAENVKSEKGERISSHDLAGSHSITQLKKALALEIAGVNRAKDRMTVSVKVTNVGSGHRIPTGVPTRKLILFCEVRVPGGKVYKKRVVYEKAIFDEQGIELTSDADIMLGKGASLAKDNRIHPKETRNEHFTFYIPNNKGAIVSVWVDYLYSPAILTETEMRIELSRDETVSGEQ